MTLQQSSRGNKAVKDSRGATVRVSADIVAKTQNNSDTIAFWIAFFLWATFFDVTVLILPVALSKIARLAFLNDITLPTPFTSITRLVPPSIREFDVAFGEQIGFIHF